MQKLLVALGIAVCLLLLVQIIDRHREPQERKHLHDAITALSDASRAQAEELRRLRQAVERAPVATAATVQAQAAPVAAGDGLPALDRDFLLPPLTGTLKPAHIGGVLRVFEKSVPNGLNNLLDNLISVSNANGLMNDGLCDTDPAQPERWRQALASSVRISDGWKTFRFTIRPGVRWHVPQLAKEPGFAWLAQERLVTARDVALYVQLINNPDVECPQMKGYYEGCTAEAVDDHTLVVRWEKAQFTNIDFSLGLRPMPAHIYTSNADGTPVPPHQVGALFNRHWFDERKQFVGCGGYQLASFEPGKRLEFTRFDSYWGEGMHYQGIAWDGTVLQDDPQLVAFKNGQVQYIDGMLPTQFKSEILQRNEPRFAAPVNDDPKAGRSGAFAWERCRGRSYNYIGWNQRRPQLADKRTRQALAYAFPRQRVIDEVWVGLGRAQLGTIHPDSPYAAKGLDPYDFSLDKAKRLLAEAGWSDRDNDGWLDRDGPDGKPVALRFKVTHFAASPSWVNMLAIYRDTLKQIGVELVADPVEGKEWERRTDDKDFDGICAGWGIGLDADYVQLWHSRYADEPKSSNFIGFRNAEVDKLSDELRATFEVPARKAIVDRVERIIWDEMPYLFVRSGESVLIWQNDPASPKGMLDGVADGLDRWHPLFNRNQATWFLRQAK